MIEFLTGPATHAVIATGCFVMGVVATHERRSMVPPWLLFLFAIGNAFAALR